MTSLSHVILTNTLISPMVADGVVPSLSHPLPYPLWSQMEIQQIRSLFFLTHIKAGADSENCNNVVRSKPSEATTWKPTYAESNSKRRDRTGESPFNHHSGGKIKQHSTVDENTKRDITIKNMATDCWVVQKEFGQAAPQLRPAGIHSLQLSPTGNKYRWNIPHLTGGSGDLWVFNPKAPCLF